MRHRAIPPRAVPGCQGRAAQAAGTAMVLHRYCIATVPVSCIWYRVDIVLFAWRPRKVWVGCEPSALKGALLQILCAHSLRVPLGQWRSKAVGRVADLLDCAGEEGEREPQRHQGPALQGGCREQPTFFQQLTAAPAHLLPSTAAACPADCSPSEPARASRPRAATAREQGLPAAGPRAQVIAGPAPPTCGPAPAGPAPTLQVDPARLARLLDFMTQQGWVRQPAGGGGGG